MTTIRYETIAQNIGQVTQNGAEVQVSWRDPESGTYLSALPPATPPMQWRSGTTLIHGWFGWMAGVGVRF